MKKKICDLLNQEELLYLHSIAFEHLIEYSNSHEVSIYKYLTNESLHKENYIINLKNGGMIIDEVIDLTCNFIMRIEEDSLFKLRLNTLNNNEEKRTRFFNPYYEEEQKQYKL